MIRYQHNPSKNKSAIAKQADTFAYLKRRIDEQDRTIAELKAMLVLERRENNRLRNERAA